MASIAIQDRPAEMAREQVLDWASRDERLRAAEKKDDVRLLVAQLSGLWPVIRELAGARSTAVELFGEHLESLQETVGWRA